MYILFYSLLSVSELHNGRPNVDENDSSKSSFDMLQQSINSLGFP